MPDKKYPSLICDSGKLWGHAGGQLEYVSQRVEHRQYPDGKHYQVMIIRFTDHDHSFYSGDEEFPPFEGMIENKYYELEFPIHV